MRRCWLVSVSILGALSACAQLAGIRDGELIEDASVPSRSRDGGAPEDAASEASIDGGDPIRSIAAGGAHTCIVYEDGRLRCWGDNEYGQLGLGDLLSRGKTRESMAQTFVDLGTSWKTDHVALGRMQSCAVSTGTGPDARLKCWGRLGPDVDVDGGSKVDTPMPPTGDAVPMMQSSVRTVAAGLSHICAVGTPALNVMCWGAGDRPPVPLRVGSVAAGLDFTCELFETTRDVRCWAAGPRAPIEVGDIDLRDASVDAIAARHAHACARLSSGTVACWGSDQAAQLAPGAQPDANGPVPPIAFEAPVRVVSAGTRHTCVLLESGAVKCWGDNAKGQLGLAGVDTTKGKGFTAMSLPAVDLGGARALMLATGDEHTCVVLEGHTVKCWGNNTSGQLGIGEESTNTAGRKPGDLPRAAL